MSKNKNSLVTYIILFYLIWSSYELLIKPLILQMPILPNTFIQTIIKLSVWTLPSYILIKNSSYLEISYPYLFQNKIKWKKWIILLLVMVLYLILGSYFQYGDLKIRETFQIISIINSVLFVGITEEMVFRGLILNTLLTKVNKWGALILSSILFVVIHFPTWIYTGTLVANLISGGFIQVFILSLIFGYSFIKSKNIFVPIVLHMVWNLFTIMFYS